MSDFHKFSAAVAAKFDDMSKHELFEVEVEDIFASYLAAFPAGTNPIFRERTEHDCSCCKHFVRNIGNVVALINGKRTSIWDIEGVEAPYDAVAKRMAQIVEQLPIQKPFRTKERQFGVSSNVALVGAETVRFHHFVATIARRHQASEPATAVSDLMATAQVLRRGLEELKADAFDTVVDLIDTNALYRGAEFKEQVTSFRRLVNDYAKASPSDREAFVWMAVGERFARFRNTAIGTLLVDLSDGVDLERAVRSFEQKVAPTNYKRPTALITQKMVDAAVKTLEDLGLESAIHRRFARASDVSVNNVLWVDNDVRGKMKDGIAGLLSADVKRRTVDVDKATEIAADAFLRDVLPKARHVDLLLENRMMGNFVSITAPERDDVEPLFKWANNFAWSYDGDVTDSIKQRVKAAGGNVQADLRISLGWHNFDDLDIHCDAPGYSHIYFANKLGILDVDMNAGSGKSRDAVENLAFMKPRDGVYRVSVKNYTRRESVDVGFTLEVECNGVLRTFTSLKSPADGRTVDALAVHVKGGVVTKIDVDKSLIEGSMSQDKWGVATQALVPVNMLMLSPNYWDGQAIGNKHWFFILHGAKNPDSTRGIYNEFLNSKLDAHRKVLEVLGSRTKCPPSDDQLSGVGFSSTRNEKATFIVTSSNGSRAYTVQF